VVVFQHQGPDRLKSCFVGDVVCTSLHKLVTMPTPKPTAATPSE
jgi:hypothetical protein